MDDTQEDGQIVSRKNGLNALVVINDSFFALSGREGLMKARDAGVTTCVTWSSVPPVVPVLIHISAAIETAKGSPATGGELVQALGILRRIRQSDDYAPEEYKSVASSYAQGDPESREVVLPRDIIGRILECLLERKDPVLMLAGHKGGVPLRAWLATELVERVRAFCRRRCSKSAFFITAATTHFAERGVDINVLG